MSACRDHGERKQEYRRSWSDNSGLVNTEMLQMVKEYEIMMYVAHMPVLNQLGSLWQRKEMAVYNVSFPELALCTAALLLFRSFIPEQVRNSFCWHFKPNSLGSFKKKSLGDFH